MREELVILFSLTLRARSPSLLLSSAAPFSNQAQPPPLARASPAEFPMDIPSSPNSLLALDQSWILIDENGSFQSRPPTTSPVASPARPVVIEIREVRKGEDADTSSPQTGQMFNVALQVAEHAPLRGQQRDARVSLELAEQTLSLVSREGTLISPVLMQSPPHEAEEDGVVASSSSAANEEFIKTDTTHAAFEPLCCVHEDCPGEEEGGRSNTGEDDDEEEEDSCDNEEDDEEEDLSEDDDDDDPDTESEHGDRPGHHILASCSSPEDKTERLSILQWFLGLYGCGNYRVAPLVFSHLFAFLLGAGCSALLRGRSLANSPHCSAQGNGHGSSTSQASSAS
jgi:hypothetical protein